jgi:YbbR domain-containing protein
MRGFFSRNWKLKSAALGLSVFLWALVRLDASTPEDLRFDVEVEMANDDWAIVDGPDPGVVTVRFEGPFTEVSRLARTAPSIVIPIGAVASSDTVVFLRTEWIPMGGAVGLSVLEMTPPSISLRFQRQVGQAFPVATRFSESLRGSLALAEPVEMTPSQIRVRGASGLLAARDSIVLMPFDLSRIRMTDTVDVRVDTTGLVGMTLEDSIVRLRFVVEPSASVILDVPVAMNGMPDATDLEVSPLSVTVELIGAESVVGAIDQSLITARVDVSELTDLVPGGRRRLTVGLRGVPELVEARIVPPTVEVRRVQSR